MKYKAHLRIPTEMYAYIEVEVEDTPEMIHAAYLQFTDLVRPKTGLGDKEYNKVIDSYLLGNSMHSEEYGAMSDKQKETVQVIKRALARIEAHQTRE